MTSAQDCQKFLDDFLSKPTTELPGWVRNLKRLFRKDCRNPLNALMISAVKTGNTTTVRRLVKYAGNVNAKEHDDNALHWAVYSGNLKIVKLLLDGGAYLEVRDFKANTPLHLAVEKGHLEIVKELVKRGAEVNKPNIDGMTPLHVAAQSDQVDVVMFLLENGADVKAKTSLFFGKTAYDVASSQEIKELLKRVAENFKDVEAWSPLFEDDCRNPLNALMISAVKTGNTTTVRRLVKYAGNVNAKEHDVNALHWAVYSGNLKIVKLLLDGGECRAEVNKPNIDGMTPLHMAAQSDQVDVVMFLLANGADVKAKTSLFFGKTAYDVAASQEIKELLKPTNT
eukprot:s1967_g11.t1